MRTPHTLPAANASYRQGLACAIAAFGCWGLFPMYWRLLQNVPSIEVVCHRIVWSFLLLSIVFAISHWRKRTNASSLANENGLVNASPKSPMSRTKIAMIYTLAALLISINWLTFIWAVNHGRVLEASLGYYINPLLSVLLAVVCLGERMSRAQGTAIAVAAIGVGVMAFAGGAMPWISLGLASSFAIYGMVKKAAPLGAMTGLLIETTVLLVPAIIYLLSLEADGEGQLGNAAHDSGLVVFLLVLGGCITVLPLALFATAAQRVPLSTIGMLQYIGPTLQFAIGVILFNEPLGIARCIGFVLVWAGSLTFLLAAKPKNQVGAFACEERVFVPE